MERVVWQEHPTLKAPPFLITLGGWPDAQEGASGAIRFLNHKLPAHKFAELESEEFYDFTRMRPLVFLDDQGNRHVKWPTNEFFYWQNETGPRDMVLFLGIEPHLRWKTFGSAFMEVAEACGASMVMVVGSLLDAIPHTREPRVSGSANRPQFRRALEEMGIYGSGYQGPTGATTAIVEACNRRGIPYASVWGHSPHYIQTSPNPKVSLAITRRLIQFLGLPVAVEELEAASARFEDEVSKAVAGNIEVMAIIRRLEQRYDEGQVSAAAQPLSQDVIKELEEFLRQQQGGQEPPERRPA